MTTKKAGDLIEIGDILWEAEVRDVGIDSYKIGFWFRCWLVRGTGGERVSASTYFYRKGQANERVTDRFHKLKADRMARSRTEAAQQAVRKLENEIEDLKSKLATTEKDLRWAKDNLSSVED
jgi:hypothetical protein